MPRDYPIIAFEGLDCSFKETNYKAFVSRLKYIENEHPEVVIHTEAFPRYGQWASKPSEAWLRGELDRSVLMNKPQAVCSLYAIDRFDYWYNTNNGAIKNLSDEGRLHYFVFDRYIFSNPIYNPMYPNEVNIKDFTFEKDVFNIPMPDIIVWMRMRDFNVLKQLLAAKENKDQNEMDFEFLKKVWLRSEAVIDNPVLFRELGIKLIVVDCLNEDGSIKSKEELRNYIWEQVNSVINI